MKLILSFNSDSKWPKNSQNLDNPEKRIYVAYGD